MKVDYFTIPEITVSYKDTVKPSERAVISCAADAAKIMGTALKDCMEHHEEVYVLFLNRRNRVLGISNIAKGGLSGALVDVRIILQTALKVSASGIIISHNHASGSITPSQEDLKMTQKIKTACELLEIKLLDHVIMTSEVYTSFAEEGLLWQSSN
jgi:DNA repair protein RadC